MTDESEKEYVYLTERLDISNGKDLIALYNELYDIINKKLTLKEKYTLATLLEIECELTKREMIK